MFSRILPRPLESQPMHQEAHPLLPALAFLLAVAGFATPALAQPAAAPAAPAQSAAVSVAFLGDSLTGGYGLDGDQAYPAVINRTFKAEGREVEVINAGISGDTTAGGLARIDWLLRRKPDILVVCLGANDGLRGLSLASSEQNLRAIVAKGQAAGARVLLVGMQIPPNYGPEYTRGFAAIYPKLAKELNLPLVPFLLEGVAGKKELNQADGIHPTAPGQEMLAKTVLVHLRPLLQQVAKAKSR